MAEARVAVKLVSVDTREFSAKSQHPTDQEVGKTFFILWEHTFLKRLSRFRTQIKNGLWPTTFYNLKIAFFVTFAYLIIDPGFLRPVTKFLWKVGGFFSIDERLPFYLRALIMAALASFLFFMALLYTRRMLLRALLAYRGWMYTTRNSRSSWKTLTWCAGLRIISGLAQPTLYSCQLSLPRMPVPPLKDTMERLFRSLEPLHKDKPEELAKLRQEADDFVKGIGKRVQRLLILKSWWAPNYVADWWEKYVYLRSRSPLPNNSNFYMMDCPNWVPTCKATARAASAITGYVQFKYNIDHETLEPLLIQNSVPLCMNQYERLFSAVRRPGDEFDELVQFKESRHIVVCYKNCWYRVEVANIHGRPYKAWALEVTLDNIVNEVDNVNPVDPDSDEAKIGALTALDRTRWAGARRQLIASSEANRYAVSCIESSIFVLHLEHRSFSDISERGEFSLHGDGKSFWFDKVIQMIVFADSHIAFNLEHTPSDAPVMAHAFEIFNGEELSTKLYDENTGHGLEFTRAGLKARPPKAERLEFDLGPSSDPVQESTNDEKTSETPFPKNNSLRSTVRFAYEYSVRNNNELHLHVAIHTAFGKGDMKRCKVSPDSFVQVALQLAFLRDQNRLALTYESSMTRLYLQGRTETVRSLTPETYELLQAVDNADIPIEQKRNLMRKACEVHQKISRDAINGCGIDRHLFALYVCARGLGEDVPFLSHVLSLSWCLSTSQTPLQQVSHALVDPDAPYLVDKISIGGGFGPVSDNGYGVSYFFAGENRLFFHVSSKQKQKGSESDTKKTDSVRFAKRIFAALADLRALFELS